MKYSLMVAITIFLTQANAEYKNTNIVLNGQHHDGEATFDKLGTMNGPFVAYTQETKITGNMVNGKPHGKVIEAGISGNQSTKILVTTTYKNGQVTGPYERKVNGKIVESGNYLNGRPVGVWQETVNGSLVAKTYSTKKVKLHKTAQQKKNDEYIQRMADRAMAESRYKAKQAEKKLEALQRCIASAGADVQKYLACQK